MLLAINVENKIINASVFSGKTEMATFKLSVSTERTSDEYGASIVSILRAKKFDLKEIDSAVIKSDIPEITATIKSALEDYLRCLIMIVEEGAALKASGDTAELNALRIYYEENGPKERESRGIMVY